MDTKGITSMSPTEYREAVTKIALKQAQREQDAQIIASDTYQAVKGAHDFISWFTGAVDTGEDDDDADVHCTSCGHYHADYLSCR